VPAAERKPKDEIVAVGLTKKQRKQKKRTAPGDEGSPRKKTKLTPPGDSSASSSTPAVPTSPPPVAEKKKGKNKVKLEEIPAFDYAQEPNGLDSFKAAPPTKLARKPKKPKGRESVAMVVDLKLTPAAIVDTSNFRKPPEDPSAPKAGSRSAVFKK
jgi:exosome complex exonuclease RRP6